MNTTKRYASIIFMIVLTTILSVNFSTVKASDSPAHAASIWTTTDGFEGSYWERWYCWQTIVSSDNFCRVSSSHPRTGTNGGFISVRSGWSDIRKWISVTPFLAGRNLTCVAQIYIYIRDVAIPDGFTAQLEVIDATTSQYISVKKINSTTHAWQSITTSAWNPPHQNILVRLGGIGVDWAVQTADLDDLTIQCTY